MVELNQTGTFRKLYRLSYTAAATWQLTTGLKTFFFQSQPTKDSTAAKFDNKNLPLVLFSCTPMKLLEDYWGRSYHHCWADFNPNSGLMRPPFPDAPFQQNGRRCRCRCSRNKICSDWMEFEFLKFFRKICSVGPHLVRFDSWPRNVDL